jgi:hypothetical protein
LPLTDFSPGQILTATHVDSIIRQTIPPFASSAARDAAYAAIGGATEGSVSYMSDAPNRLEYFDGFAWRKITQEAVTFTPSWTNLTIGNGTQTAAYGYIGPAHLWFQIATFLGTTSSVSTNPTVAIPNGHTAVGTNNGGVLCVDASGTQGYAAQWFTGNTQTSIVIASATGYLTSTNPMTWAQADAIHLSGIIRYL